MIVRVAVSLAIRYLKLEDSMPVLKYDMYSVSNFAATSSNCPNNYKFYLIQLQNSITISYLFKFILIQLFQQILNLI